MVKSVISVILGTVVFSAVIAVPAGADDLAPKEQVCSACHGQNGVPVNAMTPIIWGQQGNYLYKELHDYHSGARANLIMAPLVQSFSLEELRQVANDFAAKTWPPAHAAAPPGAPPEGIAMCRACHGQNFEGGAPAPRLAGLSYDYLVASMRSFADGERTNNGDMPGFMRALSDSQREAIAHYLAAL
jgi:cytochrome c553